MGVLEVDPIAWAFGLGAQDGPFAVTGQVTPKPPPPGSAEAGPPAPRRRRPGQRDQREAADLAAMLARMARALTRRAEAGDLEALVALREVGVAVAVESQLAARALNEVQGYSWAMIALRLGESKRAVYARWGERSEHGD